MGPWAIFYMRGPACERREKCEALFGHEKREAQGHGPLPPPKTATACSTPLACKMLLYVLRRNNIHYTNYNINYSSYFFVYGCAALQMCCLQTTRCDADYIVIITLRDGE